MEPKDNLGEKYKDCSTLGKYKVIKNLGSGGTAKVKLGYDIENKRYVALKILKSQYVENNME